LFRSRGHRLFDEHMLSGAHGRQRQFEMRGHGCRNHDSVHRGIVNEIPLVGGYRHSRVSRLHLCELLGADRGGGSAASTGRFRDLAYVVRPPVPVANHAARNPAVSCVRPCRRAGTPATIASAGTSCVTTAPAPTSARSPIVTPHMMTAPLP